MTITSTLLTCDLASLFDDAFKRLHITLVNPPNRTQLIGHSSGELRQRQDALERFNRVVAHDPVYIS